MESWLTPSVIISACGILATAMLGLPTLYFARRIDLRQQSADRPMVNLKIEPEGGAYLVTMLINNRTDADWTLERIAFPRGTVRAINYWTALESDGAGGWHLSTNFLPERPVRELLIDGDIEASGGKLKRQFYFSPSSARRRVKMSVILRSMEARPRAITLKVMLAIPVSTSSSST